MQPELNELNTHKIWISLPYLGTQGTNIINNCTKKRRKLLKQPIQFIIIFDTRKISYFTSNKDKVPPLSRFNVIYHVTCPGCNKSYVVKTLS